MIVLIEEESCEVDGLVEWVLEVQGVATKFVTAENIFIISCHVMKRTTSVSYLSFLVFV